MNQAAQKEGLRPLIFSTLVDRRLSESSRRPTAFSSTVSRLSSRRWRRELGVQSSHTVGRSHSARNSNEYFHRIEAINFALSHDDGQTTRNLDEADVILVGVSRCGKTPTCLYMALQFGIRAANYPLDPG